MPRYIDLDKLLKGLEDELKDKNPKDIAYLVFKLFIGKLNQEPTADVVPKSEVEQLKRNLEQCENGYRQQIHLLQCKFADKKREIFEEVEKIIRKHNECPQYRLMIELYELKKKYTEENK